MTKQLRRRIMLTMMLLLSLTFISIIIAINVWIRAGSRTDADNNLRFLMQREIKPVVPKADSEKDTDGKPEEKDTDFKNNPPENDNTPEFVPGKQIDRRMEIVTAHFILVRYSSDNQLVSIENSLSDSYSDEEIEQYCEEILKKGKSQGTIKQLRYMLYQNNDGCIIAFIDHTAQVRNDRNLLTISIILGVTGLIAFAFLSYLLSGLMVQPVEEAFNKQKQFISDASHELKTPITVILSNSELLEDQIGENKQLSYIKKECDQMHHLVSSLLTLTQLEQTPYENMEKNTFSLSDALLERILPLESVAYEKGITMQDNITPNLFFFGVKEQLQQVAAILIDNALAHTDDKGIINISLHKTQHHLVFTVSNTGGAIPEEEREKLFERFYRMDKARNRASGHYGLGLSIAKTIVNNHKGKIHIECKDGITSFIVTLKLVEK